MESVWCKSIEAPRFDTLKGDIATEVLIIGGGMAGILIAYMLDKQGVPYVLIEADRICSGVTRNTTAKLTFQHGLIYDKIIKRYGFCASLDYLQAQSSSVHKFAEILKDIDCEFSFCDSIVYSLDNRKKIEREVKALNSLGCDADFLSTTELPIDIAGAVRVKRQAQFHPLKAAYSLAKNLKIFENTKVLELIPDGALTNHGKIKARQIIVATHFPFINKHGSYFLKMYRHRSYEVALENAQQVQGMYVDESGKGLSFRNYNGLLLLGGGGHRTGKDGTAWQGLREFAEQHYKESSEVACWATQDCMTLDSMPYIGRYSKGTPNLYVATGFNKWGMNQSMLSAMILSDLVQGNFNEYAHIVSPSRSMLHGQLAINAVEAVTNLIKPTAPRCPHLGCALKYNKYEHSWDCPCHGSRFAENGQSY